MCLKLQGHDVPYPSCKARKPEQQDAKIYTVPDFMLGNS